MISINEDELINLLFLQLFLKKYMIKREYLPVYIEANLSHLLNNN